MISSAGVMGLQREGGRDLEDGDACCIMRLNGECVRRDCLT